MMLMLLMSTMTGKKRTMNVINGDIKRRKTKTNGYTMSDECDEFDDVWGEDHDDNNDDDDDDDDDANDENDVDDNDDNSDDAMPMMATTTAMMKPRINITMMIMMIMVV